MARGLWQEGSVFVLLASGQSAERQCLIDAVSDGGWFPLPPVPQDMSACESNAPAEDGPHPQQGEEGPGPVSRVFALHAPCQPLFLLAGLWAACVPLVWLLPAGWVPERGVWHGRELLLGGAGAAAGGYLLTSLPAWARGRRVPAGVAVVAAVLWCLARVAGCLEVMTGLRGADRMAGLANAVYFLFVALALAVPLARAGAVRRSWLAAGLMLAAGAVAAGSSGRGGMPASFMTMPFVLLLAYTGGRAVPAFTAAWLSRSTAGARLPEPLAAMPLLPVIAAAGLLEGAGWPVAGGWFWLAAAGIVLTAALRWQTVRTLRYPALFWLHVAYAWIPAAFLLLALASWLPEMAGPAAGRHALTTGAMGSMMMAVMLRPAMQRREGRLIMTPLMAFSLALIQLSALLRLCAEATGREANLAGAALAWSLGWVLFVIAFRPAVTGPVPRPAFSARLD